MASSLLRTSIVCSDRLCPARSTLPRSGPPEFPFACKIQQTSSASFLRGTVSKASEGRDAFSGADLEVERDSPAPDVPSSKVTLPPRMCSLREFGEGTVALGSDAKVSNFFELLAANIELSNKVQDWEILSGRLAMMVFATAVLVEAVTGNSVFDKMDAQRLLEICGAVFASIVVAAGFAVALQAKTRVAYSVSKGYESMMNALIDSVFDSLLFDREDS